jgi:putative membrane protein
MKTILLVFVCILFSAALGYSDRFNTDSPDKDFVLSAADGGMLEVKLGELAVSRAGSAPFKNFGKTMVRDHMKVNEELKELARQKQIQLPSGLSRAKQQLYDSLAKQRGEKFDMLYMNIMIASHEETVGLFQNESNQGLDADLKKWANAKIPALKHHLEMAKALFPSTGSHATQH